MAIPRINLNDFLRDAGLRDRYVKALLKMKTDGVYQIFVNWHADGVVASVAHDNLCFLAWHRIYIRLFEMEMQRVDQALQTAANPAFDAATVISLPWWDYPRMDSSNPIHDRGRMWEERFLGPDGSGPLGEFAVTLGPFRADHVWPIRARTGGPLAAPTLGANSPPVLTRNMADATLRLMSQDEIDHTISMLDTFDNNALTGGSPGGPPGASDSSSFRAVLEGFAPSGGVKRKNWSQMHNGVHGAVGGLMGRPSVSPNDPCFWLHHCNVDRLWARWQTRFPSNLAAQWPSDAAIDNVRTTGVSGIVNPNARQRGQPMEPWLMDSMDWLAEAGGPALMTTQAYTANHVLNWTAMGAGLGSYTISDVNGRSISF